MRLHLHGGMLGAAEFALGSEIEVADALAAGYRIHQDPDDGFIHGTPMMRCKWSAWVGSPVAPSPEQARKEALREADKALMAAGDARSAKARSEQARGRDTDDRRKAELAEGHAWALRNQADGLWEGAATVRALAEGDN